MIELFLNFKEAVETKNPAFLKETTKTLYHRLKEDLSETSVERILTTNNPLQQTLQHCAQDPEFYHLFETALSFISISGTHNSKITALKKSAKEYFRHYESTNVELLDLSFLNRYASQTPLGKERKSDKEYPDITTTSLSKMLVSFWEEDERRAAYLSAEEKKLLKVRKSEDGLLRREIDKGAVLPSSRYVYIISPKGGLYAMRPDDEKFFNTSHVVREEEMGLLGNFNHSSFRGGQPIICGGEMTVENGRISSLSPKSGHYQPTEEQLKTGVLWLLEQGIIDENCRVFFHNKTNFATEDEMMEMMGQKSAVENFTTAGELARLAAEHPSPAKISKIGREFINLKTPAHIFSGRRT